MEKSIEEKLRKCWNNKEEEGVEDKRRSENGLIKWLKEE